MNIIYYFTDRSDRNRAIKALASRGLGPINCPDANVVTVDEAVLKAKPMTDDILRNCGGGTLPKFTVWHAKHPTFGRTDIPFTPENYEKVAVVQARELDDVFRLTNHIESDWTTNLQVTPVEGRSGKNTRSTSVGDVVEDEKGGQFLCDPVGWKKLN